jgi:hypothetical protein
VIDRARALCFPVLWNAHTICTHLLSHGIPNHVTVCDFESFKALLVAFGEDGCEKLSAFHRARGAAQLLRSA